MATGKTIALTISTFVDKVIALFFNLLSRFVTAFLPGSKCLFISWLQSPCTSHHCILDFFVDHDGYSISFKGFLPTVVDIMVI